LVQGNKIPCTCDDDCIHQPNAIGGNCYIETDNGPNALTDSTKCTDTPISNAFCYPPDVPYTEWKKGFSSFNGAPTEDTCVITFSQAKVWCEMPWTRNATTSDGTNADPPCWKIQYKQPFYYNKDDGRCYVTKSYCENELSNGGFDSSFGKANDYFLFSTCSTPFGDDKEIMDGYDCCTSLGSSFAQFFFGQTIPAEFDNFKSIISTAVKGDSGSNPTAISRCLAETESAIDADLVPLISFLSDERLKKNITLVEDNGVGMGISVYNYEWTPEAKRLYKKPSGKVEGLIMKELETIFPNSVRLSPFGHKVFTHIPQLMPPIHDVKFLIYATVMMYLMSSNDVIREL
jgi:hypothetical protein